MVLSFLVLGLVSLVFLMLFVLLQMMVQLCGWIFFFQVVLVWFWVIQLFCIMCVSIIFMVGCICCLKFLQWLCGLGIREVRQVVCVSVRFLGVVWKYVCVVEYMLQSLIGLLLFQQIVLRQFCKILDLVKDCLICVESSYFLILWLGVWVWLYFLSSRVFLMSWLVRVELFCIFLLCVRCCICCVSLRGLRLQCLKKCWFLLVISVLIMKGLILLSCIRVWLIV